MRCQAEEICHEVARHRAVTCIRVRLCGPQQLRPQTMTSTLSILLLIYDLNSIAEGRPRRESWF